MREIVGVGILLAVLALIAVVLLVADKKRHGLFPDDGIVWNTEIEKRMRRFENGETAEDKRGC